MAIVERLLPRHWDGRRLLRFLAGLALLALAFTGVVPAAAAPAASVPVTAPAAADTRAQLDPPADSQVQLAPAAVSQLKQLTPAAVSQLKQLTPAAVSQLNQVAPAADSAAQLGQLASAVVEGPARPVAAPVAVGVTGRERTGVDSECQHAAGPRAPPLV